VKILFTADLHIKLGQKNVPVPWAKNRYHLLFDELEELQQQADIVVLGGDIFDRLPSMEELELYFDLINRFIIPTFIYSGNHEALKKGTTFLTNLKKVSKSVNKNITIIDDFFTYEGVDFIPYNKLKEYHPADIDFHSDILCTHVRGDIPPHVKAEVPLELFDRWKIVLSGDLHSYANSQRNILYPGSPVTTSFHRSLVDTGVIIFDTSTLVHVWTKLNLPQLIRKTIKAGDPMPATDLHHTIYEIEGDMSELSNIENSDLIDKKVVKRDIDTTLILAPTMSLTEEVEEYLRYVLQLNDASVHSVLKELSNHIGEITE
jgi:DNA repair exonuclease SbcCD nuclease subunit